MIKLIFAVMAFLAIITNTVFVGCNKKVMTSEISTIVESEPAADDNEVIMVVQEDKDTTPKVITKKADRLVTVYFDFDSDELRNSERWKLEDIAEPVRLIGGASPEGMDDYNFSLGIRRAVAVRVFLEHRGVKINSWKSVGERELITKNKNEYWMNRRCEVRY